METYCICLEATHDWEKAAVLTKKGAGSTNSARHAKRLILVEAGQTVHLKCRRHLFRPQKKNATSRSRATCTFVQRNAPVISRRSVTPSFDYQENPKFGTTRLYWCVHEKKLQEYFGDKIVIATTKKQVFWITLKLLSYLITKVNCFRNFP